MNDEHFRMKSISSFLNEGDDILYFFCSLKSVYVGFKLPLELTCKLTRLGSFLIKFLIANFFNRYRTILDF